MKQGRSATGTVLTVEVVPYRLSRFRDFFWNNRSSSSSSSSSRNLNNRGSSTSHRPANYLILEDVGPGHIKI